MSSTPPPAGSTGTTTAGSTDQSGWSHPPNTSKPATLRSYPRCSPYESGTKPGALHTAGSGYDYLTRQVAALDATAKGHVGLASYYTERAETPGWWIGSGVAAINGLSAGDAVTAEQMRALF